MLGVCCDLDHGICADPHQQIVDLALVGACDIGDLFGQSKNQMEVAHWSQFGLARGQPSCCGPCLALGAVPVPTGIVRDVFVRAVLTAGYVAAERRRAAALDCRHHLELIKADVTCIGRAPRRAMVTEDIRDFQTCPCQRGLWRAFLTLFTFGLAKIVQRTLHCRDHAGSTVGIPRRGGQFGVPAQRLYDPDIDPALK